MSYVTLKRLFFWLGTWVSPRKIYYLNEVLNFLSVGRWFADRKMRVPVRCADREPLYDQVFKFVQEPASYLEFGVYTGGTLRYWSGLLKNKDSVLHGFDSFEGLPEYWNVWMGKGSFDIKGNLPEFKDARVKLFKGWFSDTLPQYLKEHTPSGSLVVHLDADLYSSTVCVLKALRPYFKAGTILIFDEFQDREHELRAFTEFLEEEKCTVECLGGTNGMAQAAFRITAIPAVTR